MTGFQLFAGRLRRAWTVVLVPGRSVGTAGKTSPLPNLRFDEWVCNGDQGPRTANREPRTRASLEIEPSGGLSEQMRTVAVEAEAHARVGVNAEACIRGYNIGDGNSNGEMLCAITLVHIPAMHRWDASPSVWSFTHNFLPQPSGTDRQVPMDRWWPNIVLVSHLLNGLAAAEFRSTGHRLMIISMGERLAESHQRMPCPARGHTRAKPA